MPTHQSDRFPEIDQVPVNLSKIAAFKSERPFVGLAVDLLSEVASYTCIGACILGPEATWDRDRAVVGGLMVRLFKLLSALLDQVCQERREISDILARLIFETGVGVRYLVHCCAPELTTSYIRRSMRHERTLSDRIHANIAGRSGTILPIEDRMLKSIDRAARVAGINLEDIDTKDRSDWGRVNLRQKAEIVGWGDGPYEAVFSNLSHNIHGSWQDLCSHHLNVEEDGRFTPNTDWSRIRPQPLFAIGLLMLEVNQDAIGFLGGSEALDQLDDKLHSLHNRIQCVDTAHEAYLSSKTWPEI